MQKKWLVKEAIDSTVVDQFRSILKVDPIVAELLLQRGIDSFEKAEAFFRPNLTELHDPFLMKDMGIAVDRLKYAIENNQRIMLFGDYDVDGTTAVALMYSFLKEKMDVIFYIPDRYKEGYGISRQGIETAIDEKIDLIISLDCGIKANEEIDFARKSGIDFVVCDHHTPSDVLPNAIVLDPKRNDCNYPYDGLSGCGVGFKLLQGLCSTMNYKLADLYELLDLVAISIGADIVPITGENRILCHHGMRMLNENPRPAFRELLRLAKRSFPVTLTDVVFSIAPRINAVGRLRSGMEAVKLMVSNDDEQIRQLAEEIDADNQERRNLDASITEEALEQLDGDENKERVTNVLFSPEWHKGVVGIVASRVMEKYYKPTIILTESDGLVTGSARSVRDFDIHEALQQCEDLLEQFGGHKYAAGLTMKPENLEAFKDRFEEVVAASIQKSQLIEQQNVDIEIDFDQIFGQNENRMKVPRLKRILNQFEPHGPGNMKPVFVSKNVFSTDLRILKEQHLKLSMTQPEHDVIIEGIGFNLADKLDNVSSGIPFDVLYTIEINRWNNRETIQLNIKDIRESV